MDLQKRPRCTVTNVLLSRSQRPFNVLCRLPTTRCISGVTGEGGRGGERTAPGETRPEINFLWLNLERTLDK